MHFLRGDEVQDDGEVREVMRVKSHVRWEPQEEGMMSAAASFPSV